MRVSIEGARRDAEAVRFSADRVHHHSYGDVSRARQLRDAFYKTGLLISEQTTPALAGGFSEVCDNLGLPKDCVEAFVYSSPEIQAQCFGGSLEECTVRFSSALVNLLDNDEFCFVAGHELGHFLLGHGVARANDNPSIEYYMQMRAQEISVDRIGLIACGEIQTAIRALMKAVSGLERRHLRFDTGYFISQLSRVSPSSRSEALGNTHPSVIVRCRALLWFSMDIDVRDYPGSIDRDRINALDDKVIADFSKYVDGPARERIEQTKQNLALWMAALEVASDGRFEKHEQVKFRDTFGDQLLEKLINFLSALNKDEVHDAIYERVKASREELEGVIPESFDSVYRSIASNVKKHFGCE